MPDVAIPARAKVNGLYVNSALAKTEAIENGYDEDSFAAAELSVERSPLTPGCFTLLHSGIVYPSERDPRPLFAALGRMRNDGRLAAAKLRVRFRASVHHELLQGLAKETGTTDFVDKRFLDNCRARAAF